LQTFLSRRLSRYADERNQPDEDVASGLSPWLHFGHLSVHEVFCDLTAMEVWSPDRLGDVRETRGAREGWWGMSKPAEAFLDELVTWRELGFNMCSRNPHYDQYESLPNWALETLSAHASDVRPVIYSHDEMAAAATHDRIWNAAQNQLLQEGRMHNYLRMLWGKKILEWSPSPQAALEIMIELNNRYALDGRDPNSYSGIFWVLGRYDRAWGPERPIFGKVRYMTSENTARKLSLTQYLDRYAPERRSGRLFS
jgi:deoxyribodipyrimidine photo-lyase